MAELHERGIETHVGDQSDPEFLAGLAERYGGFDVVIDDGSHHCEHQIASIEHLWPHVSEGGVYIVEDLHSNYWSNYGGGRGRSDTFMAWLTRRIDDMHAYHSREEGFEANDWTRSLAGQHIYDSVAVLDKAPCPPPVHRMTGRPVFDDIYGTDNGQAIDEHHRAQLESLGSPMARIRRALREPRATLDRVAERLR